MKKVVFAIVAVLGIASAAWAFTPNTQASKPLTAEQDHNHKVELSSHESHQHDVADSNCRRYQCTRCGVIKDAVPWNNKWEKPNPSGCKATSSGNHIWECY